MGHYVNDDGSAVTTSIIPIVDFGGWDSASLGQKRLIAAQLIEACQSIGFVYIRNHKIPPARIAEAFSWSQKLFDLSSEEKKLAPHPDGSAVHRGYSWPGLEKVTNLKGDEEDAHLAQELRQVADVKVFLASLLTPTRYLAYKRPLIIPLLRRATKSVVKLTRSNLMSGFQSTSCRASVLS